MSKKNAVVVLSSFGFDALSGAIFEAIIYLIFVSGFKATSSADFMQGIGFFASIAMLYLFIGPMMSGASDLIGRHRILILSYAINIASFLLMIVAWYLQNRGLALIVLYVAQFGQATTPVVTAAMADDFTGKEQFSYVLRVVLLWILVVTVIQLVGSGLTSDPAHLRHHIFYGLGLSVFLECIALFLVLFFYCPLPQHQQMLVVDVPVILQGLWEFVENKSLLWLSAAYLLFHFAWGFYYQLLEILLNQNDGGNAVAINSAVLFQGVVITISLIVTATRLCKMFQLERIFQISLYCFGGGLICLIMHSTVALWLGMFLVSIATGNIVGYLWYLGLAWVKPKQRGAFMGVLNVFCVITWAGSGYVVNTEVVSSPYYIMMIALIIFIGSIIILRLLPKNK